MIEQKELKELLDYNHETGLFSWKRKMNGFVKAGSIAGTADTHGYIQIQIKKKLYLASRLAWIYVYGNVPNNNIDHINRDRKDNRIVNLREATNGQNRANSSPKNNYKGASWNEKKRKWISQITVNNRCMYLGSFDSEIEAGQAYKAAASKHFGEFMRESK